MLWLADDCVDASLVKRLHEVGHDVAYMLDDLAGARDEEIIRRAQAENRLLLTEDRDFGELVFRRGTEVPGIVHIRITPEHRKLKWPQLQMIIAVMETKLFGRYTVVEPTRFRSRNLPLGL